MAEKKSKKSGIKITPKEYEALVKAGQAAMKRGGYKAVEEYEASIPEKKSSFALTEKEVERLLKDGAAAAKKKGQTLKEYVDSTPDKDAKPKKKEQAGRVLVDGKPVLKEWEPFVKKYNIKTQKELDAAIKKHINYE